jgi:CBS domain-containing protein
MPPQRRVSELMNPDVVCATPDMTVAQTQLLLSQRGVSGAPVVDTDGQAVGVISQSDLVRHQSHRTTAGDSGRFYSDVDEYQDIAEQPVDRSQTPIRELMSPHVFSVTRDTGVAAAASIMRERRIHRLLVTERGRLVGVVSSLDLLQVVIEHG